MSGVSDLHPARFLTTCAAKRLGRTVVLFDRVASTNAVAMEAAAAGAPEGLLVVAETQTAGRGRKGRSWFSTPEKSLVFSLLLRPPAGRNGLTALFGLAAARALDPFAGDVAIKWPNDVFCRGRKLGGILAEAGGGAAVVGMGINVNEAAGDFPASIARRAISLRMASGAEHDRLAVLARVIESFERLYDRWRREGFPPVRPELESRLLYLGKRVVVETGEGSVRGSMAGVTAEGYLRLLVEGKERIFASGDLSLRRSPHAVVAAKKR